MKKIIFYIVIFLSLPACAIDYSDFPPALQQIIDQRTAELSSKGGVFVAGSVVASDEAYFGSRNELQVNFLQGVDVPLDIYDSGWFIMDRPCQTDSRYGPAKLALRAFGYDPIDATIATPRGEITYAEFVMQKTTAEDLAIITGTVTDNEGEPFEGVNVYLTFPHTYSPAKGYPQMSTITEPNGLYSFENLSSTEYNVYVPATSGYAGVSTQVKPAKGKTTTRTLILHPSLKIVIDYVYQADGSRDFTSGNLKTGTIEWANGSKGVDFSDGRAEEYEPESLRDIDIWQSQGELKFRICYGNGQQDEQLNGYYDAGGADFDSITEAAETGYRMDMKPCIVGHTYVVRTYENNYAKFVVRSISEE